MAKKTLEAWLAECLTRETKCTALLCIQKIGSSDQEVWKLELPEGKQWDYKELGEIFVNKAAVRVQEEPGSHLFHMLAFFGGNLPGDMFPFRVNSSAELGGGATEEPTERGARAQSMRHAEAAFQSSFRHTQYLIQATLEMNRDLMKGMRESMSERADALELVQKVVLAHAANQSELRMKEMAYMRTVQLEAAAAKFLPALTNTIAGREVFPQSTEDTALVEMLLNSFGEDQIKLLAATLRPEAQAILATRAAAFYKAKREAEETAARAVTSNGKTHELEDNGTTEN